MRQATVYIDSQALQYNLNRVKQLAPNAKIVSMVKANAYGHGVKDCLAALSETDAFGVACLEEALEIRELGLTQPITLIEGVFSADEMQTVIEQNIECVVHQQQQVDWLISHKAAYIDQKLKVWVKLNSGMNRLGFKVAEIIDVINTLKAEGFTCVLAMHFANADVDQIGNDPNGYNEYYNGRPTMADKVTLAYNEGLGGMMIWELGQDAFNQYSLLTTIANTVSTLKTTSFESLAYTLYPNPTQDNVTIAMTTTQRIEQVAIYDVLGKIVLEDKSLRKATQVTYGGTYAEKV